MGTAARPRTAQNKQPKTQLLPSVPQQVLPPHKAVVDVLQRAASWKIAVSGSAGVAVEEVEE